MRLNGKSVPSRGQKSVGIPHLPGEVTEVNFAELAVGWMRASADPENNPVVRRRVDVVAFSAWLSYLARIGVRTSFTEKMGVMTVPTVFPWDFSTDADYLRDEDWEQFRYEQVAEISPEKRRQLADMMRASMPPSVRQASTRPKRKSVSIFEGEVETRIAAPITLSDEARDALLGKYR